jgi:hypothetical protein
VVEHMPSKGKALRSNPRTVKKKICIYIFYIYVKKGKIFPEPLRKHMK